MNPITAYNSKASDYAAYRIPYAGDIVTAVLDLTGLYGACTMVDAAAGTGIVSSMFIEHVTRIIAKESWEQYIGGVRSAAAAPSVNDPAYREFEQDQRTLFDSKAVNGTLAVEYCTVIEAGKL